MDMKFAKIQGERKGEYLENIIIPSMKRKGPSLIYWNIDSLMKFVPGLGLLQYLNKYIFLAKYIKAK